MAPCPQAMRVVARTEATGRTASAREGAIGPPGCDAPVDSAHERYWSAGMNAAAQKKPRRKPENTSCTMGAVSQKRCGGFRAGAGFTARVTARSSSRQPDPQAARLSLTAGPDCAATAAKALFSGKAATI